MSKQFQPTFGARRDRDHPQESTAWYPPPLRHDRTSESPSSETRTILPSTPPPPRPPRRPSPSAPPPPPRTRALLRHRHQLVPARHQRHAPRRVPRDDPARPAQRRPRTRRHRHRRADQLRRPEPTLRLSLAPGGSPRAPLQKTRDVRAPQLVQGKERLPPRLVDRDDGAPHRRRRAAAPTSLASRPARANRLALAALTSSTLNARWRCPGGAPCPWSWRL